MWRPDSHLSLQVYQGDLTRSLKSGIKDRTQKESVAAQGVFLHTPGCDQAIYWLRKSQIEILLTYQRCWNSPTVQELDSKPQIRSLDARWHFANLITWEEGKKKISPLDSRAVRNSSASQHESQLVRQSYSLFSSLEHNKCVCCVCRQQEGDDHLLSDAERKGMVRKEGKEFIMLSIPLAVPSQEISVSPLHHLELQTHQSHTVAPEKTTEETYFLVDLQLKWQLKNNCALEIGTVSAQVNWTFDYLYNQPLRYSLISADGTERKIIWYQSWILTCS